MVDRRLKLLLDAVNAIDLAAALMRGQTLVTYKLDPSRRSAVERKLEILGEACAGLGKEEPLIFGRFPATRLAVMLRHRIAHGYDNIYDEIVFATVEIDLPVLRATLWAWLQQLDPLA